MQHKPVRNILSYETIVHQPVTVSSNIHMQPNTCSYK